MRLHFIASCFLTLSIVAAPARARADEGSPGFHENVGIGFVTAGVVFSFLGTIALYIGLHGDDAAPDDPSTEEIRTAVVTGGCFGLGLGAVLATAGIAAIFDDPEPHAPARRAAVVPRPGGAVLELTVGF